MFELTFTKVVPTTFSNGYDKPDDGYCDSRLSVVVATDWDITRVADAMASDGYKLSMVQHKGDKS